MRVSKRKIVQAFQVFREVDHTMKFDLSFEHFFDENSTSDTTDRVNSISHQIRMTKLMNYLSFDEEIITKNLTSQNHSMNIRFIINDIAEARITNIEQITKNSKIQRAIHSEDENIMKSEDENVITQNSNLIIVHVEQQRRKIILKRLSITKKIENFIMKEFSSSKKKNLFFRI
jgi:hypothetical protein